MSMTNSYATLVQVKAALRMGTADTTDDSLLEMAIESASRMIDDDCDRVFYASGTGVTRYFESCDEDELDIDDCISISSIAIDWDYDGVYETTLGTAGYRTVPLNGVQAGRPWPITGIETRIGYYLPTFDEVPTVAITGNWGFGTAVPTEVTQACVIQSLRVFKRLDSPLGVAGFGDMGAVRVSRTDPDVFAMIRRYKRNGMVGLA